MLRLDEVPRHLPREENFCSAVCGRHNSLRFYMRYKHNADSLIIMFPGAYDRTKGITQFQRYSWSASLPGHVLIFDDPTISADNDLTIGWFQGKCESRLFIFLRKAIEAFMDALSVNASRTLFFGSSAGGFVGLKCAQMFPDAYAAVINPQTNVLSYAPSHVDRLLSYSFGVENRAALPKSSIVRLSAALNLRGSGKIFYLQNVDDVYHMERHLKPFRDLVGRGGRVSETHLLTGSLEKVRKVNFIYYNDPERGHSPPSKEDTLKFIYLAHRYVVRGEKNGGGECGE